MGSVEETFWVADQFPAVPAVYITEQHSSETLQGCEKEIPGLSASMICPRINLVLDNFPDKYTFRARPTWHSGPFMCS